MTTKSRAATSKPPRRNERRQQRDRKRNPYRVEVQTIMVRMGVKK